MPIRTFSCRFAGECVFRGREFCGDGEAPATLPLRSYHPDPSKGELPECYVHHIARSLEFWRSQKDRFARSLARLMRHSLGLELNRDQVVDAVSLLVAHHDAGKLTRNYQEGVRGYRHELISAFLLWDRALMLGQEFGLGEADRMLLAAALTSACYLHHEAIQVMFRMWDVRAPTYGDLLSRLSRLEVETLPYAKELVEWQEREATGRILGHFDWPRCIRGREMVSKLAKAVTLVDGAANPVEVRMTVSALLLALTYADNVAAMQRGGAVRSFHRAILGV